MDFSIILYIFVGAFGLVIGSFLNSVIFRLRSDESPFVGRSHCMNCQVDLEVIDLIPVLSFLFLRGKCRRCGARISWQYPIVEVTITVLAILFFNRSFGYPVSVDSFTHLLPWLLLLHGFVAATALVAIFVTDLRDGIIPDAVTYPMIWFSILMLMYIDIIRHVSFFSFDSYAVRGLLAALAVGLVFYAMVALSHERWMGLGDVKMGFLLGLIVGYPGILLTLFIAYVGGAIISLGLLASGKKQLQSEVPFGTFLAVATLVTLLWGAPIINAYWSLINGVSLHLI